MEGLSFYGCQCFQMPRQSYGLSRPAIDLARSADCFLIELFSSHETKIEVYDPEGFVLEREETREEGLHLKFLFTCEELLSEEGREMLKQNLSDCGYFPPAVIPAIARQIVTTCGNAFRKGDVDRRRRTLEGHPRRRLFVPMCVIISLLTIVQDESEPVPEIWTVPASEEAMESLKKLNFSGEGAAVEEETSCCICLDELVGEGLQLPCSHAYHPDCITRWLKTSNMCPLCRSQLPE